MRLIFLMLHTIGQFQALPYLTLPLVISEATEYCEDFHLIFPHNMMAISFYFFDMKAIGQRLFYSSIK